MMKRMKELKEELDEAEAAIRQSEEHLRQMIGWKSEVLRLLEEEDRHG
jgi:hypothetical protein